MRYEEVRGIKAIIADDPSWPNPANIYINFPFILYAAQMKIKGRSGDDIDKALEMMRQAVFDNIE